MAITPSPLPPGDAVRFSPLHSGVAQWLACWAHNPKVRGSKPRSATFVSRSAVLGRHTFAPSLHSSSLLKILLSCLALCQIRCSIVVSISACHAEDPGSISGGGVFADEHALHQISQQSHLTMSAWHTCSLAMASRISNVPPNQFAQSPL